MSNLGRIPAAIFAVAVPLFLITGSITWAFNDTGLYVRGFQRYHVAEFSGITDSDLQQIAGALKNYFNSKQEPLAIRSRIFGEDRDLFNQREVLHMRDVKRLVWGIYALTALSVVYLAAAVVTGFLSHGRRFTEILAHRFLRGGGLTVGLVLAVGVFALVGFDALFLMFHQLSFSNDLWQLDPRTDYLLILFPQGFWFDATMRVALTSVAGALGLVGVSAVFLGFRWWFGPNRSYWRRSGNPELVQPDAPEMPSNNDPWR